jgi:HTH-type transcriptional regulator/antitoxin HigA
MHELSHISLHYNLLASPIWDDLELIDESDIEIEANRLAADALIPRQIWRKAEVHRSLAESDAIKMATQAEIHPAIAAGMLRKKNNNYQLFSNLINTVDTTEIFGTI